MVLEVAGGVQGMQLIAHVEQHLELQGESFHHRLQAQETAMMLTRS